MISMNYLIGEQLGAMIAHFENDLTEDIDDLVTLQKLALASEAFKNFSNGNMEGFTESFEKGYQSASKDVRDMERRRQAQFMNELTSRSDKPEP